MFRNRRERARTRRARLSTALLAVALLGATACDDDAAPEPPAPTLDRFYNQQLTWGSCDGYAGGKELGAAGIDCARVRVPVDYAKPDGETALIAISRLKAHGTKVASALTNPGGPGGPGLEMPLSLAKSALAERFDIIGIDVRGLGASTPKVECLTTEESWREEQILGLDDFFGEIDQIEEESEDYAISCAQRTGLEFLGHVGTVDVARDMDVIRAVLGDTKLTYVGWSYGTRIGSTFAELFPDRVRAMVLDGPVDPTTNMLDPVIGSAAIQAAFDAYAADCAKAPDCPVGTDPAKANETYRALVEPLLEKPLTTSDSRMITYEDIRSATLSAMYSDKLWPELTRGLTELSRGNGDALLGDAEAYNEEINSDVYNAVLCLEEIRVTDRKVAADLDRRADAAAPVFDTKAGAGHSEAPLEECAFWPIAPTAQPHVPTIVGLPKVVVVATTIDPATPYQGGVNLAKTLGAALITNEGAQHGIAFDGKACIDDPLMKYLVDLTPPADGLRCPRG